MHAARRDLLAALPGRTAAARLRPSVEGEWCGRDVLLHMAAWLRELACVVPDLATYGSGIGAPVGTPVVVYDTSATDTWH